MSVPLDNVADAMLAAWQAGDAERVIALAAQLRVVDAGDEQSLLLLGLAQQQAGQYAQATGTFARLSQLWPDVSAYWNNLGVAQRQAGNFADSQRALLRAATLAPHDAEVRYNLGLLYIQQRRWAPARDALLEAVHLAPSLVEARLEAAHACHVCGDVEGEEAMLEGVGRWPAQPAGQALVLASILSGLGRLQPALDVLARARLPEGPAAGPLRLRIAAQRVALYERNNLADRAAHALQQLPLAALDALPPDAREARVDGWRAHAVLAMRTGRHAEAAALYQRVLDAAGDPETVAGAAFGLAAACDRQAQYAAAWRALGVAHAAQVDIVRKVAPDLLAPRSQPLPMVSRSLDAAAYAAWRPLALPVAPRSPVFVIGFPRSGTTLLEQMLDAHPDFRSMDERGYVYQLIERMEHAGQRYPADLAELAAHDANELRAVYFRLVAQTVPDLGSRRLVDKNPMNMLCLPLIRRLFPDAPVILCLRHPCDVLLSCSMQSFRSPAFMAMCASPARLARGYADAFTQCCHHIEVCQPRVLAWRYEDVVRDFQGAARRLAEFLEVADASAFAGFAAHARAKQFIATPSYARVTQPVDAASVGRWQHYRTQLQPALPILQPWLDRFDYAV